jgi:Predicted Zn-dependent protease (DUF2268)
VSGRATGASASTTGTRLACRIIVGGTMRKRLKTVSVTFLLFLAPAIAVPTQNRDPKTARIVTEDIDRFWQAFDRAAPEFSAEPFETLYLSRGTPGLKDFIALRIGDAEKLATTIRKHPRYYASIRESTQRIHEMETNIRTAFFKLKELYPDAVFPDVYFLIGRMTSGGTLSERALLIGAEMHGRTPQTPLDELGDWHRTVIKPVETLPYIVTHELIHYQQKYPDSQVLLHQAIREGSADFLGEFISGHHGNHHVHEFADPREAELWREFQPKMHGTDFSGWLYSGSEGRPNDLGYWIGYKIVKSYYDRAADKRQAIRDILEIKDFDQFLSKSGYSYKFEAPPPKGGRPRALVRPAARALRPARPGARHRPGGALLQ